MPIPADFSFTSNALNYKYEIYNQSAHRSGSKSSGLLVGDYGGATKWDGDPGEGGATQYTIKYYVDIATAADSADINLVFDRSEYDVRYRSAAFFSDLGDRIISDDVFLNVKIKLNKALS